ncbi:MAG: response regulator transcription factor [Acidobacteriaceae bacterium]|jgi:DNA-binding response OmpR family regulator|nr:response regulator transcription factor [Acidobacteriaceae bacterium]
MLESPRVSGPPQLLIVEDEANIRDLVSLHLESEGYTCQSVSNGSDAFELLKADPYALVLLDVMLPGMNGLQLCREVRSGGVNANVPILMLTARGEEVDKLAGFQGGADDYLTKPFSILELSARVAALLRRTRRLTRTDEQAIPIEFDGIRLDPAKRSLQMHGHKIPVTPHEFRLFYQLAANRGIVFSRERLLADVWQGEVFVTERSVDTLVYRLRCKIEPDPAQPAHILTVWGEGYKCAEA